MSGLAGALVGRERELELVEQLLDETCAGDARFLFVAGEPGIGKTHLLAELAGRAKSRGCLALHGSAAEFERELPFGLLVDAVDEYLESLGPGSFQRLAADDLGELAGVFPALRALDPGSDRPAMPADRFRAHRAVGHLLEALAVKQPLVLALDDLHWADGASVELTSHLLRRPPRAEMLLATTFRRGQIGRPLLTAIERGCVRRAARSSSAHCRAPKQRRFWADSRQQRSGACTKRAEAIRSISWSSPEWGAQMRCSWTTPERT